MDYVAELQSVLCMIQQSILEYDARNGLQSYIICVIRSRADRAFCQPLFCSVIKPGLPAPDARKTIVRSGVNIVKNALFVDETIPQ